MRLIHSSASIAPDEEQILNESRLGRLCGIRITPVLVCSPMNAAKCRGIVLTSCVNKTRPACAATASTSGLRPPDLPNPYLAPSENPSQVHGAWPLPE